jgi:hypothetical protein
MLLEGNEKERSLQVSVERPRVQTLALPRKGKDIVSAQERLGG